MKGTKIFLTSRVSKRHEDEKRLPLTTGAVKHGASVKDE